jgi:O-antigen/teichoic acid export membrane protein
MLPFYDHRGFITIAIYRVAIFLISFLQLPFKAMTSATFPVLAKAFADDDHPKAKNIFIRSSLNILIPTVVISLMICCNLRNVVDIIKNGYDEVTPVFLILFLGGFVNIITGMNDSVLSIANLYKINFYLSLVLIIVLFILLRIFIPRYGIYGAAWSTTTTLILFNIAKCFFVWKKLDMQPFSRNTLLVILAAIPALAAGFYFPYLFNPEHHIYIHTFIDTTIRSIIILIIYLLMLLWLKPSADLEEYLASIKKNRKFF